MALSVKHLQEVGPEFKHPSSNAPNALKHENLSLDAQNSSKRLDKVVTYNSETGRFQELNSQLA